MKSEILTTKLTPEDGKYLTQVDTLKDEHERVFSTCVFLSPNDSPDNWREADESEKAEWEQDMQAADEIEAECTNE